MRPRVQGASREGKNKYRRPGQERLWGPATLPFSHSLSLARNPASNTAGRHPGERRAAAPSAAQDAPGSKSESSAARSARHSGPRGQPSGARRRLGHPCLARLRGHKEAAPRPSTGTDEWVSTGPTPQLACPAARVPRLLGEIRTRQEGRAFPGNDSSPPLSPPRGGPRVLAAPTPPRPCRPTPTPPRAVSGGAGGRFPSPRPRPPLTRGRRGSEPPAPGSLHEGAPPPRPPSRPGELLPLTSSAAEHSGGREATGGRARAGGRGAASSLRLAAASSSATASSRVRGSAAMSARLTLSASLAARLQSRSSLRRRVRRGPVPPLAAPRHSALQPSFLTLFFPSLPLSPGRRKRLVSQQLSGAEEPPPFCCFPPCVRPPGGRAEEAGGSRRPGEVGASRARAVLGSRICPAAPDRRRRLDSSSLEPEDCFRYTGQRLAFGVQPGARDVQGTPLGLVP